jgi:hypothetical protein
MKKNSGSVSVPVCLEETSKLLEAYAPSIMRGNLRNRHTP